MNQELSSAVMGDFFFIRLSISKSVCKNNYQLKERISYNFAGGQCQSFQECYCFFFFFFFSFVCKKLGGTWGKKNNSRVSHLQCYIMACTGSLSLVTL